MRGRFGIVSSSSINNSFILGLPCPQRIPAHDDSERRQGFSRLDAGRRRGPRRRCPAVDSSLIAGGGVVFRDQCGGRHERVSHVVPGAVYYQGLGPLANDAGRNLQCCPGRNGDRWFDDCASRRPLRQAAVDPGIAADDVDGNGVERICTGCCEAASGACAGWHGDRDGAGVHDGAGGGICASTQA